MDNKQFEREIMGAVYTALDSQGIEVPEMPVIESLGPHITIKDSGNGSVISVIYIAKPVIKNEQRRTDLGSVQRNSESDQKRT